MESCKMESCKMTGAHYSIGCLIGAAFCLFGLSFCGHFPVDTAMSAEKGRASTIALCGLGEGCHKGMLFKQIQSGSAATGIIKLRVPKFDCDYPACVRFQIIQPDGSEGHRGAILKGETEASFKLSDVIQAPTVNFPEHDEEYVVKVKAWFKYKDIDGDQRDTTMIAWSYIRINPVEEDYQFIGCNDPMAAWEVPLPQGKVFYSTVFRGALCK